MSAPTAAERRVLDAIAERREDLVELTSALVRLDTTARAVGDPPREERVLQELLARRLEGVGARIDLFEPDAEAMAGRPLVPAGLDFVGRPQLIAALEGRGAGPRLVFNGHIDVVPADPAAGWTAPPFEPTVRDGLLYGRGACDMKGGIAAMTVAAEALASLGLLAGTLIVATNTDEESSGAGGSALVARGLRADGAIVTEPTGLQVWTCCRGSSYAEVTVPGRAGHAEVPQPSWQDGGAVNAVEKATVVLRALQELRARWAADPLLRHERLAAPDVVPTIARAGDWAVTIPATCTLTVAALFLPAQADAHGFGGSVEREVEEWVVRRCGELDPWLAAHPPRFAWTDAAVMPYEASSEAQVVQAALDAVEVVGRPRVTAGLDSWFDAATLHVLGGIPSVGLGPAGLAAGARPVAHTADEHVPVDDLVAVAQALGVAALRFCGAV